MGEVKQMSERTGQSKWEFRLEGALRSRAGIEPFKTCHVFANVVAQDYLP
jgi:hypothetical protein